jgi:hypothetical protein
MLSIKEKYWVRMLTPDWGGVSSQDRVVSLWTPLRHFILDEREYKKFMNQPSFIPTIFFIPTLIGL